MYVVQNYISEGKDINAHDKWNNTALHWAAKGSQYRLMRLLVDNGIDVSAVNEQGENALHWSVFSNNVALLIRVLECRKRSSSIWLCNLSTSMLQTIC